ncbi:MBL fold metallo-hydrolase [Anaerotignum lactatifermentans]|uniref:MBL fold metallo-hydrolase n=1 Tax=Anaerotignum lactatifermentans TaxID=160404 RepID=A0ABS2GAJ3_9FIRM|nr:stalk domain-containing protein [Anaerotignum lactatifermentans]MBM6828368.1 MBL fold metallo-hydrolase [Anaerotignum lactatifermentans]MBM6877648.1 MBL fold metallo-hydrolase [Anaerotignum lactatifermentans]MBM6949951.1 MBL fold metallo-hydrolase [Anaerotignum lactatifermentans]
MKKIVVALLMGMLLLLPVVGVGESEGIGVSIDGDKVVYTSSSGKPFVDTAGRTQVPFRQTMEEFGCEVSWEENTQTAVASKDGIVVKAPIGEKNIYRNGVKVENDTAALIQGGRTYLPIRVVLESFGAKVVWNGAENMVEVSLSVNENGQIQVHFLDVDQADAILIDDGDFEVLIDGGTKAEGSKVVSYLSGYVDGDLDVLVATHAHEDHIGGLPAVFDRYTVDMVIDSGKSADSAIYTLYSQKRTAEQCVYETADQGRTIELPSGAKLEILPMSGNYTDANDTSVITLLDYDDVEVLFMGDASTEVEQNNLSRFSDVDVLKAGHHGSRTAGSAAFLQRVQPEYVVISAGLDNRYGHPHQEALSAYLNTGAAVYGTFRSGDIVMTTDGSEISFQTSRKLTMADVGAKSGSQTTSSVSAAAPVTTPSQPAASQPVESTAVYIGNSNSMIFHRADCSSVARMSEKNKVSLPSAAEALAQGYRGCKICNP